MLTGQLGRLPFAAEAASSAATSSRGGIASGQRLWSTTGNNRQGTQAPWQARLPANKLSIQAAALLAEVDTRNFNNTSNKINASPELQVRRCRGTKC